MSDKVTKDWRLPTQGTWFAMYGCVYSLLGDETVVRVALMDRDEPDTLPTERDANCHLIALMQNQRMQREMTPEKLELAREIIG